MCIAMSLSKSSAETRMFEYYIIIVFPFVINVIPYYLLLNLLKYLYLRKILFIFQRVYPILVTGKQRSMGVVSKSK